jgi:hypothetical protein
MRRAVLLAGLFVSLGSRAFAALDLPKAIPGNLGINVIFTKAKPGEMKLLKDLKLGWVRTEFDFDLAKSEPPYDFSGTDSLLHEFDSQGFRLVVILCSNRGAAIVPPRKAAERKAFVRWAVEIVSRYRGKGILWEFWNEPNSPEFWPAPADTADYTKLCLELGEALRQACPGEALIGPATATLEPPKMDLAFQEACFRGGLLKYWDGVTLHPYVFEDPEVVDADYQRLKGLIARYAPKGKDVPIINSESGFPSEEAAGANEVWQADMTVRRFLFDLSEGLPLSVCYSLEDPEPVAGQTWELHTGLVGRPYDPKANPVRRPKPAYEAVQALTRQLSGFSFERRLTMGGPEDYILEFRNSSGGSKIACWTRKTEGSWVDLPAAGKLLLKPSVQYLTPIMEH